MESESDQQENQGDRRPRSRSRRRSPQSCLQSPGGKGIILNRPLTPKTNEGMMAAQQGYAPSKMMLSTRRSSSGIFISSMFGARFRHLQKLHTDSFGLGLNAVCVPGLPVGAMFRSSLPATPVSTPIHREFHHFTEQAIRERLCRTPSPRKNSRFAPLPLSTNHGAASGLNCINASNFSSSDSNGSQPMELTTPTSPIPEVMEQPDSDSSPNEEWNTSQKPPIPPNPSRRLFVGNISYRIRKSDLYEFFREFGRVEDCVVVCDHIKKQSKGYGFVTFRKAEDARKVIDADKGKLVLDNRELRINYAQPKTLKTMRQEIHGKLQEKLETEKEIGEEISQGVLHHPSVVLPQADGAELTNINQLNDDILLTILSYVDDLIDRSHCSLVCSRWRKIVNRLWLTQKELVLGPTFYSLYAPALTTNVLYSILKKCPNITYIDLEGVTSHLDSKSYELIGHCCPSLERIHLSKGELTGYAMKVVSEKCKRLKEAILNECYSFTEKDLWYFLQNTRDTLEVLEIADNRKVTGKCFHVMSKRIRTLRITDCEKIKQGGYEELVKTCCEDLQVLYTSPVTKEILELICEHFKSLRELSITQFAGEPVIGFAYLAELVNLDVLSVRPQFSDCTDETVAKLVLKCSKLRVLELFRALELSDLSALAIARHNLDIKRLVIKFSKTTDRGVEALSNLLALTELDVSGSSVTDAGIKVLLSHSKLCSLDVNDCDSVTINTLFTAFDLAESRSRLANLSIAFAKKRFSPRNFKNKAQIAALFEEEEELYAGPVHYDEDENSDADQRFFDAEDPMEEFERNWVS